METNKVLISAAITLLALTGCANLKTTTIRAGITSQVSGDLRYVDHGVNYHGGHVGRVELDVPLISAHGFSVDAVYAHESLIDTDRDRGQERAGLVLEYRPFGGAL